MGSVRRAVALAAIMLGATALAAQAVSPGVLRIQLTGVIDQVNAAYIEEALTTAQTAGYQAALIEIDTPGGELSSMDRIVKAILASEVPVITYVAPEGAQAASAGTFVTMAGEGGAGAPTDPGALSAAIDSGARADGRPYTFNGEQLPKLAALEISGAVMNPGQQFLHLLSDPNIAFILFPIGFYGVLSELFHPNPITGSLGAIAIVLA